ncbi:hypothetical protein ACE1CD_14790 [Aerosakkonema sp. BLCC-F183]|uniref:hypothetical protein n=1 Tax=Aerosakkonema sp. BLCC-F183 TaxID=3342834 RepID=UPI0035B8F6E1
MVVKFEVGLSGVRDAAQTVVEKEIVVVIAAIAAAVDRLISCLKRVVIGMIPFKLFGK